MYLCRLVNFSALIVLLWSPILVPVLPSLLHQWATKSPNAVADAASVVGLYGAILILITIWGKRVRGYNKPLLKYGLRLYSRKKVRIFCCQFVSCKSGILIMAFIVHSFSSSNANEQFSSIYTGIICSKVVVIFHRKRMCHWLWVLDNCNFYQLFWHGLRYKMQLEGQLQALAWLQPYIAQMPSWDTCISTGRGYLLLMQDFQVSFEYFN